MLSFLDPEVFFIPSIKSFSFKYHCDNIEISINAMYYIIYLEHFLPPLPHLCAYMWSYAISWVIFYEQIMYIVHVYILCVWCDWSRNVWYVLKNQGFVSKYLLLNEFFLFYCISAMSAVIFHFSRTFLEICLKKKMYL